MVQLTTAQTALATKFKEFFNDPDTTTVCGKPVDKSSLAIMLTVNGTVLAKANVLDVKKVANSNPLKAGTVVENKLIVWDMDGKAQQGGSFNLVNLHPIK